jgi:hypothetical protein
MPVLSRWEEDGSFRGKMRKMVPENRVSRYFRFWIVLALK